jgi:hypothetical protein
MPAGWSMIQAKSKANSQNSGEHTAVNVIPETVDKCQKSFDRHVSACQRGEGHYPYLDRNHENDEAVAFVRGFYWSPPDPPNWPGGVMVQIDWTFLGAIYVLGGSYQRFSPTIRMLDPEHPELVTDLPACCGALVNLPAFKRLPPIMEAARHCNILPTPVSETSEEIAKAALEFKAGVDALVANAKLSTTEAFRVSRQINPAKWLAFVKHTHAEAAKQIGEAS